MITTTSYVRWLLKKGARKGMALASWPASCSMFSESTSTPRLRVLTYHRFGDALLDPFCISPKDFEKQMTYLSRRNLAVSLQDAEYFISGKKSLKEGSILITIDDGFHSLYSHALPILREHRIPAVAFITPSLIRGETSVCLDRATNGAEPYLTWKEVERIADHITIGSHAWTHRSLGAMTEAEVEYEARRSREVLERRLERRITAFAYPFGTWADFNPSTTAILERSGYTCAFTSQHGAVRSGMNIYTLPRVKVESGEGMWLFRLLTRGGLDNWCWVDRTLWRLQARTHG